MFDRAADVVGRNAINPDFLPDEDKHTPADQLLARIAGDLPARLGQETADRVVCHGDACMPNVMVDPGTLQCTGLVELGRRGTADRYADLPLTVAHAGQSRASRGQGEPTFAIPRALLGSAR